MSARHPCIDWTCRVCSCVINVGQEFASPLEALSLPPLEMRQILIYMISRGATQPVSMLSNSRWCHREHISFRTPQESHNDLPSHSI